MIHIPKEPTLWQLLKNQFTICREKGHEWESYAEGWGKDGATTEYRCCMCHSRRTGWRPLGYVLRRDERWPVDRCVPTEREFNGTGVKSITSLLDALARDKEKL